MNIQTIQNRWPKLELRVIGLLAALLFFIRIVLCVTDVNHPPGVRTVRLCAAAFVMLLAALEIRRPWLGFKLSLFIWPQMLVMREILSVHISPLFAYLPPFWAGMLVSGLCAAVWIRRERSPTPVGKWRSRWHQTLQYALYIFGSTLFISALVGQWRVGLHPAGWHIQATDFRHLWEISAFNDAMPLMTLLEVFPPIFLGLLYVQMHSDTPDSTEHFPRYSIAGWMIAGGVLMALEVLTQTLVGWHLSNDPMAAGGPFENRNTTAPLLAVCGACALAFSQSKISTEWRRWAALFLAVLLMSVAVACGSRNAVWVVGVTLFLWLLCGSLDGVRWAKLRGTIAAGMLGLSVFVVFLMPLPQAKSIHSETLARDVESLRAVRDGNWNLATSDRAGMYAAAWQMYSDYPVTGAGLGTVPMVLWSNGPYKKSLTVFDLGERLSHVHSMPLQLLAESGLLAMLSWLAIFILLPVVFLLCYKDEGVWAIPVAAMGAANLFDLVWFATGVPFFAVMLLAFIIFSKQRCKRV